MAKVSRKWIRDHIDEIPGYSIEDLPAVKGGYETNLTQRGVDAVSCGSRRLGFSIAINGNWARAFPKYDICLVEMTKRADPEWAL